MASCIIEPLLTIIDSLFVSNSLSSLSALSVSLAAMAINTSIFNFIAAATYPLCTGTTALVSRAFGEKIVDASDAAALSHILKNGIYFSVVVGMVLTLLLQSFSRNIISFVFNPEQSVLTSAVRYLKIRSLSMPFILVNYVSTGYSLGTQKMLPPVLAVSTAFFVNIIGDWLLVSRLGLGLSGASAATCLSSIVGSLVAICAIAFSETRLQQDKNIDKNSVYGRKIREDEKEVKLDCSLVLELPSARAFNIDTMRSFCSISVPLFVGSMLSTLTYSAGSIITAAVKGLAQQTVYGAGVGVAAGVAVTAATIEGAAHQIALQLWWFLSFFSVPFSLAAQSIIPRDRL